MQHATKYIDTLTLCVRRERNVSPFYMNLFLSSSRLVGLRKSVNIDVLEANAPCFSCSWCFFVRCDVTPWQVASAKAERTPALYGTLDESALVAVGKSRHE